MTDMEKMMNLLIEFGCKFNKFQITEMSKSKITGYTIDINSKNICSHGGININFNTNGKFCNFELIE